MIYCRHWGSSSRRTTATSIQHSQQWCNVCEHLAVVVVVVEILQESLTSAHFHPANCLLKLQSWLPFSQQSADKSVWAASASVSQRTNWLCHLRSFAFSHRESPSLTINRQLNQLDQFSGKRPKIPSSVAAIVDWQINYLSSSSWRERSKYLLPVGQPFHVSRSCQFKLTHQAPVFSFQSQVSVSLSASLSDKNPVLIY